MRYLLVLLLLAGCATAVPPRPPACPVVPQLALPEVQKQIDAYIASGRYEADFAAVVDSARAWLEERAPQATRPAIVLDIDETSLSNWSAYRANGSRGIGIRSAWVGWLYKARRRFGLCVLDYQVTQQSLLMRSCV